MAFSTDYSNRSAFSLVELSIVLVILGLLVGGALAGRSLIQAAELRSVHTEHTRYAAAVQTFRDKYFIIPGDMTNATAIWGTASGGCPTGARSGTQTCNGNGDGLLTVAQQEHFLFWQHLANAGLIEGSFSGRSGPSWPENDWIIGINAPGSKLSNGIWVVYRFTSFMSGDSGALDDSGIWFDGNYGNFYTLGGSRDPSSTIMGQTLITPKDLWNMDTKLDDGKPGAGKVMAYNYSTCTTATASSQTTTAAYALTNNSVQCIAIFPNAF
jgi:prepilin-type N-terminal cleavage/methylation domain-containing protein